MSLLTRSKSSTDFGSVMIPDDQPTLFKFYRSIPGTNPLWYERLSWTLDGVWISFPDKLKRFFDHNWWSSLFFKFRFYRFTWLVRWTTLRYFEEMGSVNGFRILKKRGETVRRGLRVWNYLRLSFFTGQIDDRSHYGLRKRASVKRGNPSVHS